MKKLLILLPLLLLSAYPTWWYAQSRALREDIESAAGNFNALAPGLRVEGAELRYASLEMEGFPLALNAVMSQPRITLTMRGGAWTEEISPGDSLTLSAGFSGTRYRAQTDGPWRRRGAVGGKEFFSYYLDVPSGAMCELKLELDAAVSPLPLDYRPGLDALRNGLDVFRSVECSIGPLRLTRNDGGHDAALYSADAFRLQLERRPEGERSRYLRLLLVLENGLAAPGMDAALTAASSLGNTNLHLDFARVAPARGMAGEKNGIFSLTVKPLSVATDLFSLDLALEARSAPEGERRMSRASLSAAFKSGERFDRFVKTLLGAYAARRAPPERLAEIPALAADAAPQYASLSPLRVALDASLASPLNPAEFIAGSSLSLKYLEILTALYGLKLTGELSFQGLPAGGLTMDCLECGVMLEHLGSYAPGIERLLSAALPEYGPPVLTDEAARRFGVMLMQLAEDAPESILPEHAAKDGSRDRAFDISIAGSSVMVNGHSTGELAAMFDEIVHPYLANAQPHVPTEP